MDPALPGMASEAPSVSTDAAWNRWPDANRAGGDASPWENRDTYSTFVANVVRWHVGTGRVPDHFDVPIASIAAGDAWTFELRPVGPILPAVEPTTSTTTTTTTRPRTTTTTEPSNSGKGQDKPTGKPRWGPARRQPV